jgi:hypothetical protein
VNITFQQTSKFRTEDHKAVLALTAERDKTGKALRAQRDAFQKSMANDESTDSNLASRLTDLIAGRKPAMPTPWDVRLREVQIKLRDNDDDLDFLAGKAKAFEIEAERKMLDDARPQIVAAERELFETFLKFYNQYLPYWQAGRHLRGNSIRTYELFANSFDSILGVPVDINSAFCELFREGIAAGYISKMPPALRPKQ